ncbi:hypothetical protein [Bauldia litoralis]|uniref:hypothetical protein n=1 Tax=Bauldia litoralis TaxID=665467 RepID=UPI003262EF65
MLDFTHEERTMTRLALRITLGDINLPQSERATLVAAYAKLARADGLPECPRIRSIRERPRSFTSIGELARHVVAELRPESESEHVANAVVALGDDLASPDSALKRGRYDVAQEAVRKGGA